MGMDGEDGGGVEAGLSFLKKVNGGEKVDPGKRVVVIGGGNTAMDVARCAIRSGSDVTVVTYSRMVLRALEAAEQLAEEGISVEVIDLRTLKPLDMDTVAASVKKTGRVVGVTEAYKTNSFISELAMRIQEEVFDWLDAPVVRVTAADVPVPMSEPLEDACIPNVDRIIAGIRQVLA